MWLLFASCFLPWHITHFVYSNTCLITLHFTVGSIYVVDILILEKTPNGYREKRHMGKWALTAQISWKKKSRFPQSRAQTQMLPGPECHIQGAWGELKSMCPLNWGSLNSAPADYGYMAQYCQVPWHFKRSQQSILWKNSTFSKTMCGPNKINLWDSLVCGSPIFLIVALKPSEIWYTQTAEKLLWNFPPRMVFREQSAWKA